MLQERKRRGTKSAKAEGCGLTARISEPRLAAQNPHPFLPPQSTRLFYRASARAREARLGDPGCGKDGLQNASPCGTSLRARSCAVLDSRVHRLASARGAIALRAQRLGYRLRPKRRFCCLLNSKRRRANQDCGDFLDLSVSDCGSGTRQMSLLLSSTQQIPIWLASGVPN